MSKTGPFQKHDFVVAIRTDIDKGIVKGRRFKVLRVQNLPGGRQMIEIEISFGSFVWLAGEFFQKVKE